MASRIWLKYYPENLFSKIVFWIVLMKFISLFLPIEFNHNGFRESFKFYHNGILIALLFISISREIFSDKLVKIWEKILLFVPLSVVFLFILLFVILLGYCQYEEAGTLYIQKDGGNATISRRSLNCGATTDYSYDTYYIKPLTPFFNFRWKFDDKNIDKSVWIKPTD
jgi:hypothetical protein